jgi:SH3 domain-containing YSC84-like protein 1
VSFPTLAQKVRKDGAPAVSANLFASAKDGPVDPSSRKNAEKWGTQLFVFYRAFTIRDTGSLRESRQGLQEFDLRQSIVNLTVSAPLEQRVTAAKVAHMKPFLRLLGLSIALLGLATLGWSQQDQQTAPPQDQQNNPPAAQQPDTQQTNTPPAETTEPPKDEKPTKHAKFDTQTKSTEPDVVKRLDASASVLDEIMGTPDKGIPRKILSDAKCIIVVPSMVNVAVVFGGRHGKGVATCRTSNSEHNGWSAPAPIDITGGSWGLQVGGQAIDLVMLVMNQKGMDHLLSSKFKIGAEATGAAGPIGREVEGDTDWKMKAEILTYSRARGLFAGIDLNGASIKQDRDETAVLYGKILPFQAILSGQTAAPSTSHTFLATVRKYSRVAEEKKEQGE